MSIATKWHVSVNLDLPALPPDEALEIRLNSERNKRISRFSEISERDPAADTRRISRGRNATTSFL